MNPKQLFIDRAALDHQMANRFLDFFPEVRPSLIDEGDLLALPGDTRRRFVAAKRSVFLTVQKGLLLRPLSRPYGQGKPEYYLYTETGCPFDCQYCFLQTWLTEPVPTIFVNRGQLYDQIKEAVTANNGSLYIHAGEMADALYWDPLTLQSETLVRACRDFPGLTCELRTKSDTVDRLLSVSEPPENLLLSWTLCPEDDILMFEPGTARLDERLSAMAAAAKAGFSVALRFDPVICHGNFEEKYSSLLRRVSKSLPGRPVEISTGSLRMTGKCLALARKRFPRSRLFAGELVPCFDGKWRYARPIRKKVYDVIGRACRDLWDLPIQLCMEPD